MFPVSYIKKMIAAKADTKTGSSRSRREGLSHLQGTPNCLRAQVQPHSVYFDTAQPRTKQKKTEAGTHQPTSVKMANSSA